MSTILANRNDNVAYLKQAIQLLKSIDDPVFIFSNPPLYNSGVGPHLRHCIEHYQSFVHSWKSGRIDYDARQRNSDIECNRQSAINEIEQIILLLSEFTEGDINRTVQTKMDCGDDDECPWCASTIKREFQFLISHTVHHYALIAIILKDQGITPHEDFGVAPSTLKHRITQSCAPSAG